MAKDTLTAKFTLEAEFEPIQAIRQALAEPEAGDRLISLLGDTVRAYLAGQVNGDFTLATKLKVSRPRRTRSGPATPIPRVEHNVLSWYDEYTGATNVVGRVGSSAWFSWLADSPARSFRYISKHRAAFTAIKRNNGLWYAHKRLDGKLKRRYLGRAEKLTAKKMDRIAFELSQRELV